ncbi:MAG: DUF3850 domain-containing protein [Wenzhouxiangella sp.]|nr:DUF3850 domain-containing protein [Wenzhouxiangella sp.]
MKYDDPRLMELYDLANNLGGEFYPSEMFIRIDTGDNTSKENYDDLIEITSGGELKFFEIINKYADHDTQEIEFKMKGLLGEIAEADRKIMPIAKRWLMHKQKPLVHHLKTYSFYFEQVWQGDKTFEVRYNDRNFKKGDVVWLMETHPEEPDQFTGRKIRAEVGYVLSEYQADGYVTFSLLNIVRYRKL